MKCLNKGIEPRNGMAKKATKDENKNCVTEMLLMDVCLRGANIYTKLKRTV